MLLPKNVEKTKDITPKTFFIWGQSMSGKTYLARQFPNPVIINTDGNAKKVTTPSVEIFDFETFVSVLQEIEAGKHEYETIIIDLVDDIKTMLEAYVCKKYEVETLADVGFGKAFSDVKSTWQRLMVRLSQLKYNVIFISHIVEVPDDNDSSKTIEKPSLEQKYYNMTMGRCDISIKCRKVGSTYLQLCDAKRDIYNEDDVKNKTTLNILKGVKGVFTTQTPELKKVTPVTKPSVDQNKTVTVDVESADLPVEAPKFEADNVVKKEPKKIIPIKKIEKVTEEVTEE